MTAYTEDEAGEPVEVWPLAHFLAEEMQARGWTTDDVAIRMGTREMERDLLVVCLILSVQDDKLMIDDKTFDGLAGAFGVDADFFRRLDALWRKWPDRREPFECPEELFGPAARVAIPDGELTCPWPASTPPG